MVKKMSQPPVRSSLADCILKRIQSEKITPKPKVYFRLKNTAFWTLFWISLLFGALATTMIIYSVNELGFDLLPSSALDYWFRTLPIYWVLLFLIFIALAMLGFQKTRNGYKLSFLSLLFCNFGASLFLGANMYFFGGADILDYSIQTVVDESQSMEQRKIILWDRPRQGVLSGMIIAVKEDRIWIRSFRNQIWELQLPDNTLKPVIGLSVRVTGTMANSDLFLVKTLAYWQVDPWQRMRINVGSNDNKPHFIHSIKQQPMIDNPRLLQKFLQQD